MANQDPGSSPIGDDVVEAVNEAHGRAVRAILRPQAQVGAHSDDGRGSARLRVGDVYTDIEKTMIELQRQAMVYETRSTFQQAMEHRFIAQVDRLTPRHVMRFISTHNVGPDLELELLVLKT